jgi:PAS domain-containing protein
MPAILAHIFNWLTDPGTWTGIGRILRFLRGRTLFGVVAIGISAVSGIILAFLFVKNATVYEAVFHDLLATKLAATPQAYKGLEAFIMSVLPKGVDESLKVSPAGQELANALETLVKAINTPYETAKPEELRLAEGGKGGILTDDASRGFLFLPLPILRASPVSKLSQDDPATTNMLNHLLTGEIVLLQEVGLTRSLDKCMQNLASTKIVADNADSLARTNLRQEPVQVYMVTKNGLNRIFMSGQEKPERHYARQFSWRTFFPARPYFQAAITSEDLPLATGLIDLSKVKPTDKLEDLFVLSPPYIDLAGNAVVITLSRAIRTASGIEMVLCIDLSFVDILENTLKAKLAQLHAEPETITLDLGKAGSIEPVEVSPRAQDMFERLLKHLASGKEGRATALGNVLLLNEKEAGRGAALEVSVPVKRPTKMDEEGGERVHFLLFRLDLGGFRRLIIRYGASAAICFGIMALVLMYLLATTIQRGKDYGVGLARVAEVMQKAPIAYLRLNSNDRIVDCNPVAADLLEIPPVASQRRAETFGSFCADAASTATYALVQSKRKAGEHVEPYILRLKPKGFEVLVVAEDLPPVISGAFPITFGILLPEADKRLTRNKELNDSTIVPR